MSAPSFLRPPGHPSTVRVLDEVRDLARWVLDEQRRRPLVVLTPSNDGDRPCFDAQMVQPLVGDDGDVVSIEQTREHTLTRELQRRLPPGLNVFNGAARIYWPTADVGTQPARHPLVRADGDDHSDAAKRTRLVSRWREGAEAGSPQQRPVARTTIPPTGTPPPGAVEEALFLDVVRAYLRLVPDPDVRAHLPLRAHELHPDLAAQLAALEPARAPVADAAARVLSGHAWTQATPVPQRVERNGTPVLRASDRAVAWRYPLGGSDRCVYYWQPAGGPITFVRIADARHVALSGHDAPPPVRARPRPEPLRSTAPPTKLESPASAATERPPPAAGDRYAVDDGDLLTALRAAGRPLVVSELRAALGVPDGVSAAVMRRILDDARGRGLITRTGEKRGTRYHVA